MSPGKARPVYHTVIGTQAVGCRVGGPCGPSSARAHPLCIAQAKGNPKSSFNDKNLCLVVADLFSAGTASTSITLAWALLLMILHPDVQRKPSLGVGGWGCVREERDNLGPLSLLELPGARSGGGGPALRSE